MRIEWKPKILKQKNIIYKLLLLGLYILMSTICEGRSVGNSENFIRQYLGQSLRWGFIMSKHCHALVNNKILIDISDVGEETNQMWLWFDCLSQSELWILLCQCHSCLILKATKDFWDKFGFTIHLIHTRKIIHSQWLNLYRRTLLFF